VKRSRLLAGLATVAVAALVPAAAASADASGLTIAGPNGAPIRFAGTPTVACGPWEPGVARRTIHVELRERGRGWELHAVLADVEGGGRVHFPADVLGADPRGALLFVYRRQALIEASTNEEEATGWLSFSQASCELGATVAFAVHARLGSELAGGRAVRVDGSFTGVVG
jgi:hypothetical protein